jgi:hypothetical protein
MGMLDEAGAVSGRCSSLAVQRFVCRVDFRGFKGALQMISGGIAIVPRGTILE